jgi:transposase InsO family protein
MLGRSGRRAKMPWKETDVMSQRIEFVVRAKQGEATISELCREYGVSRKTGHKWLKRYDEVGDLQGLEEISRRPRTSPNQTPRSIEDKVVELRKKHGWAGKKLSRLLEKEDISLSPSTVDRIIKRRGLGRQDKSSRPATKRFQRLYPNELWQMDFKGKYRLRGGGSCYPLSLLDDHSRFSPGLFALSEPDTLAVQTSLVSVFEQYGLPESILCDHGTPWWCSSNGHGLTTLSVGLIKQGINLIYSGFAHPQTQGKVERFHRTIGEALIHRGVPQTVPGLGVAFDEIRYEYNEIRPHESLDLQVPAAVYRPSLRQYQTHPPDWIYPENSDVKKLDSGGFIYLNRRRHFVSEALRNEQVWCQRFGERILVTYRHMHVREIDLQTAKSVAIVRPYSPKEFS